MKRIMPRPRVLLFAALLAAMAIPAFAYVDFRDASNNPAPGTVNMFSSGGVATPVTTTTPLPVASAPGTRTLVALDVASVTTGGTAVVALTAGHKSAGGWIQNPSTATVNLCIAEIGTAAGTTSAGSTTCIIPGQTYTLTPTAGAVSVIASDSAHAFSGYGYTS